MLFVDIGTCDENNQIVCAGSEKCEVGSAIAENCVKQCVCV